MRLVPAWLLLLPFCLALTPSQRAAADIFSYTDAEGVVHYTNVPVDARYEVLIRTTDSNARSALPTPQILQRVSRYSSVIDSAARANGLKPALIQAVLVAESGGDPKATSARGAQGLMQLMPATARQYGVSNAFDPEQNILAGSRYLRDLTERYRNDLNLVLAAYNAGPAAVDQHGGTVPPIRETLDYIPRVLEMYHRLLDAARTP